MTLRRSLLVLVAAAALTTPAAAAPPAGDGPSVLQQLIWRGQPVYCGGDRRRLVALTFDDGPGPYTTRLLAALRRGHAPATFFLVGSRLAYWPAEARAAARQGVLGNHTWSHAHLLGLPARTVRAQLLRTQLEIIARTRTLPSVFRPPYEQADNRVDRVAKALNLLDVRWSVDSGDSRVGATPGAVVQEVAAAVRPGSIVLLHDAHPWTADAVTAILRDLRAQRLRPVTLPTLLQLDPPTHRGGCR